LSDIIPFSNLSLVFKILLDESFSKDEASYMPHRQKVILHQKDSHENIQREPKRP
jgi:hypothetical protein